MKYLSLFSGIGGFEYGINISTQQFPTQSRGRNKNTEKNHKGNSSRTPSESRFSTAVCIGFSEIDKYAKAIYQHHYPNHPDLGDAREINTRELPDFDILVGGFPCQAFSVAGKGLGFCDTRGTLFFEIARILEDKRPPYFLLENVKGLLSNNKGETFQTILTILTDLGYFVEWQVLNSKDFGVPQNRERVFIVGHLRGNGRGKIFPITGTTRENYESFRTASQVPIRFLNRNNKNINPDVMGALDQSCSTNGIKEGMRIRRLTPTECERLQGFPDGWTQYGDFDDEIKEISDTQRYKCLGNAVTTNVISAIIKEFYEVSII